MSKRIVYVFCCALLVAAPLTAQEPKPKQEKKSTEAAESQNRAAPAVAVEAAGQPVNIRIEMTITDQAGANASAKKTVTMIVGDRQRNSIRSSANILVKDSGGGSRYRSVTINVDARPAILNNSNSRVTLDFGLEYQPRSAGGAEDLEPGMASLNERMTLLLDSGKPVVVSQAADPTSDRKITVEVTATILR